MNIIEGKKTYIGLLITFLGLIGVSNIFTQAETAQIADLIIQFVGLGIAVYGRYKAKQK